MRERDYVVTVDSNEAAAYVAHQLNEVFAISPITPDSPMGERSGTWFSAGRKTSATFTASHGFWQ